MSITRYFDIPFLVCNGYLVIRVGQLWQATLTTVMNTNIHMILETFPFSFRMAKGILKEYSVFIWKSNVLFVLSPRRRRITPNKESSREGIREKTQVQVIPLWPFRTLEKEWPVYLRNKKGKYTSFSCCWILVIGLILRFDYSHHVTEW